MAIGKRHALIGPLALWCAGAGALAACRLLSADLPCARADHCPPRYACGPAGVCVAADAPEQDGGVVDDDAGPPPDDAGPAPPAWWDPRFAVRIELDVTGGPVTDTDAPIVVDAPLQALIGARGTLDPGSPRVIDHSATDAIELPSYFSAERGDGMVALLLPGDLAAGETRRLYLYVSLIEDGAVEQPSYWLNETWDPVDGPTVSIAGLSDQPLCVSSLTEPDLSVVVNNCWRLFGTDVDHYAAPSALGSNLFTRLQAAAVRLDQPALVVVETIASAGPARLRQLTLLTSERGILTALRVEDVEPSTALEIYAYSDIDIPSGDAYDDTGFVDGTFDAAVIEDAEFLQQVALIHDGRGALETVGYFTTVADEIFSRSLSGTDVLTTADGAAAMRWAFPAVNQPVLIKDATVLVEDTSDIERIGLRFFSATATLGSMEQRR